MPGKDVLLLQRRDIVGLDQAEKEMQKLSNTLLKPGMKVK